MSYVGHIGVTDQDWLKRLFKGKKARDGGVICRSAADVEEKIGRLELERQVKARGFRMVQAGDQILIVCGSVPVRLLV